MKMSKVDAEMIRCYASELKSFAGQMVQAEFDEEMFEMIENTMNRMKARFDKYKEEA